MKAQTPIQQPAEDEAAGNQTGTDKADDNTIPSDTPTVEAMDSTGPDVESEKNDTQQGEIPVNVDTTSQIYTTDEAAEIAYYYENEYPAEEPEESMDDIEF